MSLFRFLGRIKVLVQVRGLLYECFGTGLVLQFGVVGTPLNPQSGGPPLVGCPQLLFKYICRYHPYWKHTVHVACK